MDRERFTFLLRSLRPGATRRVLLSALLSVLPAVLHGDQTAAACVKVGKRCRRKNGTTKKCCGGKCEGNRCRCGKGKRNSNGVCARRPRCRGAQKPCATGADCCSGECAAIVQLCYTSTPGERCHNNDDCGVGGKCIGFRCKS